MIHKKQDNEIKWRMLLNMLIAYASQDKKLLYAIINI